MVSGEFLKILSHVIREPSTYDESPVAIVVLGVSSGESEPSLPT